MRLPGGPTGKNPLSAMIAVIALALLATSAVSEDDFELAPIRYSASTPDNPVSRLQARLDAGETTLAWDDSSGWLGGVLAALEVPTSSQTLVFSKTSLQQTRISPRTPRALYFNDDVYVGYVRTGEVVEVSVADPALGTVFYSMEQVPGERRRFERRTEDCLLCHGGSQTRGVPGHIVRSVYPSPSGQPIFSAGSHRVDDSTALADRWGGWYVTGRHGKQRHLGNVTYPDRPATAADADPSGLNVTDLAGRFGKKGYLTGQSDLVALSVLAHQAAAHNALTRASFDVRAALYREAALNRDLEQAPDYRWPSTNTVLDGAAKALVECFLFCDEAPLAGPIEGTTTFATDFAARGPTDAAGRSLRQLDLERRLFRHPCSFLVYSASFDALPAELRGRFWARIGEVLTAADPGPRFAHLSTEDRQAIRAILVATKPDAVAHWAPAD